MNKIIKMHMISNGMQMSEMFCLYLHIRFLLFLKEMLVVSISMNSVPCLREREIAHIQEFEWNNTKIKARFY